MPDVSNLQHAPLRHRPARTVDLADPAVDALIVLFVAAPPLIRTMYRLRATRAAGAA